MSRLICNVSFFTIVSVIVCLFQTCFGHYSLQVKIKISGLPANGNWSYHGLHIHESGDMSRGCESMGPHYNPFNVNHGSQRDPVK